MRMRNDGRKELVQIIQPQVVKYECALSRRTNLPKVKIKRERDRVLCLDSG